MKKRPLDEYYEHQQKVTPDTIASVVLSEKVIKLIVKETRKTAYPKANDQIIKDLLRKKIIARDIVDKISSSHVKKAQTNNKKKRAQRGEKTTQTHFENPYRQ